MGATKQSLSVAKREQSNLCDWISLSGRPKISLGTTTTVAPSLPSCCTVPYFSNDPLLNLETCKICANKMLLSRYLLESEFFTQNLLSQQFISSSRHFSVDRHILCASMKKIYLWEWNQIMFQQLLEPYQQRRRSLFSKIRPEGA